MGNSQFNILDTPSVLCGGVVGMQNRLDVHAFILAETTPGVTAISLYTPTIEYYDGRVTRPSQYSLSLAFADKRTALWATAPGKVRPMEGPLEAARQAHARHLGAEYRLFFAEEFYANRSALKNRQTIQDHLARRRNIDTQRLENELLEKLPHGRPVPLGEVHRLIRSPESTFAPESLARLAVFRLVTSGRVDSDLEHALIQPDWCIWRHDHDQS